jgi:hypothetical protein
MSDDVVKWIVLRQRQAPLEALLAHGEQKYILPGVQIKCPTTDLFLYPCSLPTAPVSRSSRSLIFLRNLSFTD